jgi:hypothetical protein
MRSKQRLPLITCISKHNHYAEARYCGVADPLGRRNRIRDAAAGIEDDDREEDDPGGGNVEDEGEPDYTV